MGKEFMKWIKEGKKGYMITIQKILLSIKFKHASFTTLW
jgi:hypothetical protein